MKYILSLFLATAMFAETTTLEQIDIKAYDLKSCISCHGLNYEKVALGKSKIVKNMSIDDIEKILKRNRKKETYSLTKIPYRRYKHRAGVVKHSLEELIFFIEKESKW